MQETDMENETQCVIMLCMGEWDSSLEELQFSLRQRGGASLCDCGFQRKGR